MVKFDNVDGRWHVRIEADSFDEAMHEMNFHICRAARYNLSIDFIGPEKDGDKYTAVGHMG